MGDTLAFSYGRVQMRGPNAIPSTVGQVFVGRASGGRGLSDFHAGLRVFDADVTANNPTFGPNIIGGCPTNSIDLACAACTIMGGGRPGWENKILHTPGQLTGTEYQFVDGYDNYSTDGWPHRNSGAHNRINTLITILDPGFWTGYSGGTVSSSGNTVTGVGTTWSTAGLFGCQINVGAITVTITAVNSDTSLTTSGPLGASSGSTYRTSAYMWNSAYSPNANTDHSSILGTYNAIYNAHFANIISTHSTLGWDGTTNRDSSYAMIAGGQQHAGTGQGFFIGGGARIRITGAANSAGFGSDVQIRGTAANNSLAAGSFVTVDSPYCIANGNTIGIGTGSQGAAVFGEFQNAAARDILVSGNGHGVTSNAPYSVTSGRQCRNNNFGMRSHSQGQFATQGDNQDNAIKLMVATSLATAVRLSTDGTTGAHGRAIIGSCVSQNYTTSDVDYKFVARQSGTSNYAVFRGTFTVNRDSGVASTTINGGAQSSIAPTRSGGTGSAWRLSIDVDTTTDTVTNAFYDIRFTSGSAVSVRVGGTLATVEVVAP